MSHKTLRVYWVSRRMSVNDPVVTRNVDIRDEIINEPWQCNAKHTGPVSPDDESIWNRGILHRIALEASGLLHAQPPKEDSNSRNYTESKWKAPDGTQMVISKSGKYVRHGSRKIMEETRGHEHPVKYQWDESPDDEAPINHGIWAAVSGDVRIS